MKITVTAARAAAQALTSAAATAQANGQTEFDLIDALGAAADESLNALAAAIAQADGTP